jgi:hypothetical protein
MPIGRAALLAALAAAAAGAADLQVALDARKAVTAESAESQKRIDAISDDTEAMLVDFRATNKQIDTLNVYNGKMRELITAQEEELASLQAEIDEVDLVGRAIAPLLLKMVGALERFVELDVPFLPEERARRITELRDLLARSDVTSAEKYRRIMEAYQIENEYGRTIEAYRGTLESEGQTRTVDFLRVGRVALVYQTLEGQEVGAWDQAQRAWVPLASSYRASIERGIRVARKQAAPEMIRVPLPAAERLGGEG